jgi:two-component system, NarL family, nitrate/nitrite response regulator NarL
MDQNKGIVRVLILDDQLVQREGIARVVDNSSYMKLVAATSYPDEALRVLQQERIDLALVDLLLEKQRGTLVGRAMRRLSQELKVIIYTHEKSMVLAADIFWSNKSTGHPGLQGYILTGNIIGASYVQHVYEQILATGHYIDREVLEDNLRLAEFDPLTQREEECALLLANGLSNEEISQKLSISRHRIENMITNLYLKFRILGEPGNPGRRVCLAEAIHLLYGQDWKNTHHATVLIIDDQKPQRDWIIQKLSTENRLRVIGEAENGTRGLEMVRQKEPGIVLVDLHLPDVDGFWLTRKILSEFPQTQVIIHSAVISPIYDEEAGAVGATAMIYKHQINGAYIYQLCAQNGPSSNQ